MRQELEQRIAADKAGAEARLQAMRERSRGRPCTCPLCLYERTGEVTVEGLPTLARYLLDDVYRYYPYCARLAGAPSAAGAGSAGGGRRVRVCRHPASCRQRPL